MDPVYLGDQFIRGFGTLGFIIFELFVSEGRPWPVEGDCPVCRPNVIQHLKKGAGKALDSVYHFPGFSQRERRYSVKSAMNQSVAVE